MQDDLVVVGAMLLFAAGVSGATIFAGETAFYKVPEQTMQIPSPVGGIVLPVPDQSLIDLAAPIDPSYEEWGIKKTHPRELSSEITYFQQSGYGLVEAWAEPMFNPGVKVLITDEVSNRWWEYTWHALMRK